MTPFFNSSLAILFIVFGIAATFIMLELRGAPKDRPINTLSIKIHRLLGWIFTGIFIILIIVMILKTMGLQEEVSPRVALHIVLALALVPILVIKLVIVRRYPRLSKTLIAFGPGVLILAVALSGITAGYYFLHSSDIKYVSIAEFDNKILDDKLGQQVVNLKCNKCHTLERVYRAFKSQDGWTTTINRMASLDAPNISSFDVKQSIHFLVTRQESLKGEDESDLKEAIGKTIMETKCSACHALDRIVRTTKEKDKWEKTVSRMIDYSGDPVYLTQKTKEELIDYLTNK